MSYLVEVNKYFGIISMASYFINCWIVFLSSFKEKFKIQEKSKYRPSKGDGFCLASIVILEYFDGNDMILFLIDYEPHRITSVNVLIHDATGGRWHVSFDFILPKIGTLMCFRVMLLQLLSWYLSLCFLAVYLINLLHSYISFS